MSTDGEPDIVALLQDPQQKGGTSTAVSWYRQWIEMQGWNIREWYLDDTASGWPDSIRGRADIRSLSMPRVLPRLHVPQFLAARYHLRGAWGEVDAVHVIGAVCVQGSLAPSTLPAVVWMATTIADERKSILPFVSAPRRTLYRSTLPFLCSLERVVLENAAKIIAMSRHTADVLVSDGLDVRKIEVAPVPIDTTQFSPTGMPRCGVLFVGRALDPRKGFSRVVSLAASSPLVRARGVHVVTPGNRPTGLPESVDSAILWWGAVDDLPERYGSADLLVLPSYQEGLGIVAFEALACGTPVVAYRCGGPDHFLRESGGGIVVDDDESFRRSVEQLILDEARRSEMGRAGRRWVEVNMNGCQFLHNHDLFVL